MSEESLLFICPNPKCGEEFENPLVLTVLSVDPPKKYEACPKCFAKIVREKLLKEKEESDLSQIKIDSKDNEVLESKDEIETDENVSLDKEEKPDLPFFQRVKRLISNNNRSETETKELKDESVPIIEDNIPNKPETDYEPENLEQHEMIETISSEITETAKKISDSEESISKETESTECPESFGYLSNRPKDEPIPQKCLVCSRMVDCMLSPRKN